jgi:hypothetical protein
MLPISLESNLIVIVLSGHTIDDWDGRELRPAMMGCERRQEMPRLVKARLERGMRVGKHFRLGRIARREPSVAARVHLRKRFRRPAIPIPRPIRVMEAGSGTEAAERSGPKNPFPQQVWVGSVSTPDTVNRDWP